MIDLIEKLIVKAWNRAASRHHRQQSAADALDIGAAVVDEHWTGGRITIPQPKRAEHLAVLGKTGQGKSFFLRHLAAQDVQAGRGFVFFDLHGDATPFLLRLIAREEARRRVDLSTRLIVVEPGDPEFSVGLNVLERGAAGDLHVRIAEFAEILKRRWSLDHLGARTEELLRNSLHVLAENNLTLLELTPLLTDAGFRAVCLARSSNPETQSYFRARFDQQSEAMQAMFRDAILNKTSIFVGDPRFRHILGQRRSTFSLLDCLDNGYWVVVNLDKGRLGEQAATLGSLLLTKLKNALFSRSRRSFFTLYCDEVQNLIAYDNGLETLFSEARKFGVGVVSANQFLEQYPAVMRAAILAVGTHVFFQLSSLDADKIGSLLDGGRRLAESLKNLPKRNLIIKSGHQRYRQALVPMVADPLTDYSALMGRCRARWARRRTDIEAEIRARHEQATGSAEGALREWE